ncbi:tetratricopeptide repeat protein [Flavobacterium sp. NST-5]|uniref:Tetratricopeptide repeat protein n=1 Tax=Flavobacterium ichthyis TaxID=2698827 RepID=A0ABW9Z9K8_9FLAO|nr:tetratricopeptide repeat protein [Flavobacterium ichthyis]NBL65379.1 tetratricopeptide repeat protein [Flavobacterium ichthyis]
MQLKKIFYFSILTGTFWLPVTGFAQQEPDLIALAEDKFQDDFYESLKQKGIENYDKAILSLEKCLKLQPQNAVIFNELGINYFKLKNYQKAQENFNQAIKIDASNKWYLVGLYDVFYETKDYNQAITVVQKLIGFDAKYKEDLTSLYMYTNQFDKALVLINELDETSGKTAQRNAYRSQIGLTSGENASEKNNLLQAIKKDPKNEANYIELIYQYAENNQEEKAFEIAKQLEKEIPDSEFAQIGLFKFHLNKNDGQKAVSAMNKVLESKKINSDVKAKILKEFLIFVKTNPSYTADLDTAFGALESDKQAALSKEFGQLFFINKNWPQAIKFFEIYSKNNPQDAETGIFLLQSYTENKQFDEVASKSASYLDYFPMQPEFYYFSGLAFNQLKNPKKAKEILLAGIDYLVENRDLEINFNIQLGEAASALGDAKAKQEYFTKAERLLKQKQ